MNPKETNKTGIPVPARAGADGKNVLNLYEQVEYWMSQTDQGYIEPPGQPWEVLKEVPGYGNHAKRFFGIEGIYLAHGSYGAAIIPTTESRNQWSLLMEKQPSHFYYHTLFPYLVKSLRKAAYFINATPSNLVFVQNVEIGIQAVLNSIPVTKPGTWVAFDFSYGAVLSSLSAISKKRGCVLSIIPTSSTGPITDESILADFEQFVKADPSITLACFEHITSSTAIILPVAGLIDICRKYLILSLIDGAHTIGQIALNLEQMAPDFYVTNCHKWLCTPRGCALLYVSPKYCHTVHPLVVSWGYNQGMQAEFIWQGTMDYSPMLSLSTSISIYQAMDPLRIYERNHSLACWCGDILSKEWGTQTLVHQSMIGAMVCVEVPGSRTTNCADTCSRSDLHDHLAHIGIEVPVFSFRGKRYIRVSIHIYNTEDDCLALSKAVLDFQGIPDNLVVSL